MRMPRQRKFGCKSSGSTVWIGFLYFFPDSVYFSPRFGYNRINLKFSLDFKNRKDDFMNLAKISSNGQITVPVEIRRLLGLKSGDKILFLQKQNGYL